MILTMVTLIFVGILMIHSANGRDPGAASEARRQFFYALFGLTLMVIFIAMDYDFLGRICPYLYGLTVILLAAVLVMGHTVQGAQRWVSLGPLGTFQPSEMAKLTIIITLARYLSLHEKWHMKELATASGLVALPGCSFWFNPTWAPHWFLWP
jgi:rod shape determining protein RodA